MFACLSVDMFTGGEFVIWTLQQILHCAGFNNKKTILFSWFPFSLCVFQHSVQSYLILFDVHFIFIDFGASPLLKAFVAEKLASFNRFD